MLGMENIMQVNWESFKTFNQDSRGVRYKFEDLCRQLFVNENLSGNKQFRYLHANPNNYGLETEPIYDEITQQWIGFQAKFFDHSVKYDQIKDSARKIVKYYTGKAGKVDLVYLFCNQPVKSTAPTFVDTVNLLKTNNIDMQLITDTAILDLVINKYPYLGGYYFGNHTIQAEWFDKHSKQMFDVLGERYNRELNIETESLDELSLFVHDQRAADYLNTKKQGLLGKIDKYYWNCGWNREYLSALSNAIEELPDVDIESLYNASTWEDTVKVKVQGYLAELCGEKECLEDQRKEAFRIADMNEKSSEERHDAIEKAHNLGRRIDELTFLMNLPEVIAINERERSLLHGKIMILEGRAGTGKSQLLAAKTKALLDDNRMSLLLIAGIYFTDDPIREQIVKNLRLNFSLEELIDVLEIIGEKNNCIVPIFIDGINETWHNRLWKIGLPQIIDKLRDAPMVRMVVSYRPEYEQTVLPDSMKNGEEGVVNIDHRGFEDNSVEAIREFLNYYGIPFTPLEYFGYEMSNPLFLTLYCKTYNGEEVSLPDLYERLIKKADENIYFAREEELRRLGYNVGDDLSRPLIGQIAEYFVTHGEKLISKSELAKLSYWTEYGLTPAPYINCLIRENILHDSTFDNVEKLYFAYDQMNDYYCAKVIMDMCSTKEAVRKFLSEKVLGIDNNRIEFFWNIDLFINACVLYAEKYGEECIDIIDELTEDYDQEEVFSRYISAFQWRNTRGISEDSFIELLHKYPCRMDDLWAMLIGNSVKVSHPFNADFLHKLLSSYALNYRDYLWTVYINKLTWDESDRVVQLIQMYDRGEKLNAKNEKQVELLLTLFGWILASSNRWLRDYTSKAMIEILKEHFNLCKPLLHKFKDINDPYIVQRLYGVVFGAYCKRKTGDIKDLAEYVYETVFNQEQVYPDILLRDYARLIIEKFLIENPDYEGIISRERIVPPYNSDPIPDIENQYYGERDYNGAILQLMMSMRVEDMGGYGDFGRYVFQSALSYFDVDMKEMFNYAIYHIINDLGYDEEYFEDHDCHIGGYDRHLTAKIERIGKKYQWITLYEMIARISDNSNMLNRWSYPAQEELRFEGAWEPYVRDFDPTLNDKFMICAEAPVFRALEEHMSNGIAENKATDISTSMLQKNWLEHKGVFYEGLKDTLILTDDTGQKWICLTKHCDTRYKNSSVDKLLVWSWLYAYFMSPVQADEFKSCAEKGMSIISYDTASHHETYTIFNREYPWSPSCKDFEEYAWVDAHIRTGKVETITEIVQEPDFSDIEVFLRKYGGATDKEGEIPDDVILLDEDEAPKRIVDYEVPPIHSKKVIRQREVERKMGKILHATTDLLWEEEYDATKEETISRSFPCGKLIELMGLRQLEADGFFYDRDDKIAAFDTDLTQKINSVVIRKDILDNFLDQTGLKLVWLVDAQKEIHTNKSYIKDKSDWEAVFIYEGDYVEGDIHRIPEGNHW